MESELVMGCVVAGDGLICGVIERTGERDKLQTLWRRVCMHLERIKTNFKFKSEVVKVSPTEVVEINGYELFITLKSTTGTCNMYHACAHNEKEITQLCMEKWR